MKTHFQAWCTRAGLVFSVVAAGCPDTVATAPEITAIELKGSVSDPSFDLVIRGNGFGLAALHYDLDKNAGTADDLAYGAALISNTGATVVVLTPAQVALVSPNQINAHVELATPLLGGNQAPYEVDLLLDGKPVAADRGAIDVQ
jgi:hypothetical protein